MRQAGPLANGAWVNGLKSAELIFIQRLWILFEACGAAVVLMIFSQPVAPVLELPERGPRVLGLNL